MRPAAKPLRRRRSGSTLTLLQETGVAYEIDDPDGAVERLLVLLDGTRTLDDVLAELRRAIPTLCLADLEVVVASLDEVRLLEDGTARSALTPRELDRYASGLAFFRTFASLQESRFAYQERLRRSHVLLLGTGGLGSSVLLGLAGAGVGRITVVDGDRVELRNLTRQFLYTESDVGRLKAPLAVAAARARNADVRVDGVERWIEGPGDLADLVGGVDVVVCAVDRPPQVRLWVNEACAGAGIPWVAGGIMVRRLVYWSVAPGSSACFACWWLDAVGAAAGPPDGEWGPNTAIGPAASLVAGYVGLEAIRYLTRFAPPVAAGRTWLIDTATGESALAGEWMRRPDCPVCGAAPVAPA